MLSGYVLNYPFLFWKEFSIHRKSRQGLLCRMSTSFHNLAAVYMMRHRTQEFEQVREYVAALGEKLNSVDKISQHIHKERQGAYMFFFKHVLALTGHHQVKYLLKHIKGCAVAMPN
jgi:hypothetical protein